MVTYPKNELIQGVIDMALRPMVIGVLISLAICIGGIGVSIYGENWEWFSRSGALIVVAGVFVAKWDLENLVNLDNFKNLDSIIVSVARRKNLSFKGNEAGLGDVKAELENKILEYVRPRYIKAEIYIVSSGTLIWGFGDVFQG